MILAVALLGIGLGGLVYALSSGPDRRATLSAFALTCTLEAACLALPFALGDRVSLLAIALRPEGLGSARTSPAGRRSRRSRRPPRRRGRGRAVPAAHRAARRGARSRGRADWRGRRLQHRGRDARLARGRLPPPACALGHRLLPRGGRPLVALGLATLLLARRRSPADPLLALLPAAVGLAAISATGPTAAFRHAPIGAGRVDRAVIATPNAFHRFRNETRHAIGWSAMLQSSVALDATDGLAMVVNGKVDGNARADAPTQVMGGLLGAFLHPHPKSAMVIGLGTGSTAGWLGAVPSIERVDVAELEDR